MLATEDDCSSRSNSKNREGIDRATHAYRGKTGFSTEGVRAVMREASQDQDLVVSLPEGSLGLLRMNYRKKIA